LGGWKQKGCKQGRGAAGKTTFLAAIARNEIGHPIHMRLSRVKSFTSREIARWSEKHIIPDSFVITDGYRAFNGLDDAGFSHDSIVTLGIYNDPDNKLFIWVNTMIGNVKNAFHGTYHSMSSKHLPRYLAELCFRFNGRFRMELMVPSLIQHAVKTKPIPQHQLKLAEDWW
jgi:transposase-like protein